MRRPSLIQPELWQLSKSRFIGTAAFGLAPDSPAENSAAFASITVKPSGSVGRTGSSASLVTYWLARCRRPVRAGAVTFSTWIPSSGIDRSLHLRNGGIAEAHANPGPEEARHEAGRLSLGVCDIVRQRKGASRVMVRSAGGGAASRGKQRAWTLIQCPPLNSSQTGLPQQDAIIRCVP